MPAFRLVQRARTLVPTEPITAMAAITIRPAIKAYSRTSPPASSRTSLANVFVSFFIVVSPYCLESADGRSGLNCAAGFLEFPPTPGVCGRVENILGLQIG